MPRLYKISSYTSENDLQVDFLKTGHGSSFHGSVKNSSNETEKRTLSFDF